MSPRTHKRSLDVETINSAWLGWGFHCTSATSHVPPWGKNLGISNGASRSIINNPFRLCKTLQSYTGTANICNITHAANTISRLVGLILIYFSQYTSQFKQNMNVWTSQGRAYISNCISYQRLHVYLQVLFKIPIIFPSSRVTRCLVSQSRLCCCYSIVANGMIGNSGMRKVGSG